MNANVLEAARYGVRATRAWLGQPERVDPDWQRAKTQHDHALCAVILDLLAQPAAIPPGTQWYCHVVLPESHSDPDEEWYEVTHWWQVHVRAEAIDCEEYTNLATIVSAGQTYILRAHSTDKDTADLQA